MLYEAESSEAEPDPPLSSAVGTTSHQHGLQARTL